MVIYCHKNYWSLHLHQFFGMIHPEDSYASTLSYMSSCIRLWTSGTFYSFSYHKPKCKMTLIWSNPQNKTSPHKKYFTINFIHLRYKVCQILPTFTSQYQSSSLSLTPNIPILFTAIPQHVIISPIHCLGYTALLKTIHSHFWWDALPCHFDPHWINNTFPFLGL